MESSPSHFDKIARNYDSKKRKGFFPRFLRALYSTWVRNGIKDIVPENSTVLDYGCGTGELLNSLLPKDGVGYDPSSQMIKIAKTKYNNIHFVNSSKNIKGKFSYIVMCDVIEHLENVLHELTFIQKWMDKDTKLVISYVDSTWNFFLKFFEIFSLKIDEGKINRISNNELIKIANKSGLKLTKKNSLFFISIFVFNKKLSLNEKIKF